MIKKRWIYLPVLAGLIVFSFTYKRHVQDEKSDVLMNLVVQGLNASHYQSLKIDDDLSEKAFSLYLKRADYYKRFFTKDDVRQLEAYQNKIDDEMTEPSFEFLDLATKIMDERIEQSKEWVNEILASPFDLNSVATFESDPEKREFAASEKELKTRWGLILQLQTMQKMSEMMNGDADKDKDQSKETVETKSLAQYEEEARLKIKKQYDDFYARIAKLQYKDKVSDYLNAIVNVYDPHTEYFPPEDKANFDIQMSGQLEGIGAQLSEKDGYVSVEHIIPGSPCWKQGELKEGDLIIKVGQGSDDPVDIVDWRVDEAVKLIRGKKGTEVRLTVKHIDGSIKVITIIRDVVIFEETYAKSAIIRKNETDEGVGYIYLPKFYADFSKTGGRSCSKDVKIEVEKLRNENVNGIIIDLRNNGGGSLQDVVDMGGIFIEKGPIVQVKRKTGTAQPLNDNDHSISYRGPLVIMVNEFSASASEILAAAMQDYKRAVIIGSSATYGKGTVQHFFELDKMVPSSYDYVKPLGSLKITTQKFYRVNGSTTQLTGVIPDIILPDQYAYFDLGEKDNEYPLESDKIPASTYQKWTLTDKQIADLVSNSKIRVDANTTFDAIATYSRELKTKSDASVISLSWIDFKSQEDSDRKERKDFDEMLKQINGLNVDIPEVDQAGIESDTIKVASWNKFAEKLQKDIYLEEAVAVINDMR